MMTTIFAFLLITTVLLSYLACGVYIRFSKRFNLIDSPNFRSSHSKPVPRGGGIVFASIFLFELIALYLFDDLTDKPLLYSLLGSGFAIMLLGFADDIRHIPARWRLVVHFLSSAWVAYLLLISETEADMGSIIYWITILFAIFSQVWLLNLYNFMDGIDLISTSETVTVVSCGAFLIWLTMPGDPSSLLLLLLIGALLGFLPWNISPASLFMGDAGSAFLGAIIGVFVIHSGLLSPNLTFAWLILLGVYIVDATTTLLRRILNGQQFYQAHRTHAYQHAAIKFHSHTKVSVAVAMINLFWLMPLASATTFELIPGPVAIVLAYFPLLITAYRFGAGTVQPT